MLRFLRPSVKVGFGIAVASPLLLQSTAAEEMVEEPYTKTAFRSCIPDPDGPGKQYLTGVAPRCMMGWCWLPKARAYGYGVYVDDMALKAVSTKGVTFYGCDSSTESADKLLWAKLIGQDDVSRISVELQMARDIEGSHMAKGFRNSIRQRLQDFAKSVQNDVVVRDKLNEEKDMEFVTLFASKFENVDFKKHDTVMIRWRGDGSLDLLFNNKPILQEEKVSLAGIYCLFNMYMGPKSLSKAGRQAILEGLDRLAQEEGKVE